ncbi:MAG: thiamine phosphate synthase [Planctomycetota bacterium]|nr:MAG: thiamine phosphate synthase [Planctomycetota bacterium]
MNREIARIIDANFNRAREALRVMEDYARFILDDPAGCEVLKRYRHDFAHCMRGVSLDSLLLSRDILSDVGANISIPSEQQRSNPREVLVAAAKRLPEALRTIEEYTKTFDADLSSVIESLRYRAYELEQRLLVRGQKSARFAKVRLYVLITESLCRQDWWATAEEAIAGGAGCLQLREKSLDDDGLLKRARRLGGLCRDNGVLFIVNDRPDIALLSDADGVHLGRNDMSPADARRTMGPDRLIGISTHTSKQFRAAMNLAPDYISVGPMFDSETKPQSQVPGVELLRLAVNETEIPIVPIGGITTENVDILIKAGARRVCVCSAVIGADDVKAAAGAFVSRFEGE